VKLIFEIEYEDDSLESLLDMKYTLRKYSSREKIAEIINFGNKKLMDIYGNTVGRAYTVEE
jgi:hypothetical protein